MSRFHLLPQVMFVEPRGVWYKEFELGRIGESCVWRGGTYHLGWDCIFMDNTMPSKMKLRLLIHEVGHAMIWRIPFHIVRECLDWCWEVLCFGGNWTLKEYLNYQRIGRRYYGRFPWLMGFNLKYITDLEPKYLNDRASLPKPKELSR